MELNQVNGNAYVVGDSVDTDQIIPARHLVYSMSIPSERREYGRHALSGLPDGQRGLPQGDVRLTDADAWKSDFSIVVAGKNFGCGSSREHAPFALAEAGVRAVVAESFARIFYRNAVDGGFLLPFESEECLKDKIGTGDPLLIQTSSSMIKNLASGDEYLLKPLGDVLEILRAGNVFEYARRAGFIPRR